MPDLHGFTVGVTADRRADEQTAMLARMGADVMAAPVIRTLPIGDDRRLRAATEDLVARPPEYLVANTGLGVRSWMGLAATWGLDADLRLALEGTRVAARGPKAAAAATIAGLDVWWQSRAEQLSAVAERLLAEDLRGRRVAIQLHGDNRQDLSRLLIGAGAEVIELPVYRWTLPDERGPAARLIEAVAQAGVDAVTFTAGPAVRNFMTLADEVRLGREVLAAFNGPVAAICVGPVCAAAAVEEGIAAPRFPERWRLGPMVRLVAEALQARARRYRFDGRELVLQGSVVLVDGQPVRLTERERALLAKLAERPGATVSRRVLLRHVWKDPGVDPHVLETAVGRLRAKLGVSSQVLETAVRRGYRLRVD